jgi:uncharacterized protein YigA (DUF484 family)
MSQKLSSEEQQNELSWEDAVSRYLEQNPDYFERHPDILAALKLNHGTGERAVSLIERQVQVLRDQQTSLHRQLRELIGIARENDLLTARLHRFALAMLDAATRDEVLDTARDLLRQEFKLDAAVILLAVEKERAQRRPEYLAADDPQLRAVLDRLSGGKPLCGGRREIELMQFLFAATGADIQSVALIPIGASRVRGVLALGARDPQRFHSGQGTLYLTRLGELLERALAMSD